MTRGEELVAAFVRASVNEARFGRREPVDVIEYLEAVNIFIAARAAVIDAIDNLGCQHTLLDFNRTLERLPGGEAVVVEGMCHDCKAFFFKSQPVPNA